MANEMEDISTSGKDWRIPRPSLHSSSSGTESSIATSNYERNIRTVYTIEMMPDSKLDHLQIDMPNDHDWFSSASSTTSTSTTSSHSASSGALLLTSNNLDCLKHEPITVKPSDAQSVASSTHFTLVNGITGSRKPLPECCWRNHQLPVLVISMTIILFFGILGAILYIEIRATELWYT